MHRRGPYVLVDCLGGRLHGCKVTVSQHAKRCELAVTHGGQTVGYDTYEIWGELALYVFHRPTNMPAYWQP